MINLYDYQEECVNNILNAWNRGIKSSLSVLSVGAGKTIISAYLINHLLKEAKENGEYIRILYLAHKDYLLTQPLEELRNHFPDAYRQSGIVQAEKNSFTSKCVIASIATLAKDKRLEQVLEYGRFTHVIIDECHHVMSATYIKVLERIGEDGEFLHLGLTATPVRGDRKKLTVYTDEVFYISMQELIYRGFLSTPTFDLRSLPDGYAERIGERHGMIGMDYDLEQMMTILNEEQSEFLQMLYNKYIDDKCPPCVFFMPTAEMAYVLSELMKSKNHRIEFIGHMTKDRLSIIEEMRQGKVEGLTNFYTLTEGVNVKDIRTVYMCRYVHNDGAFLQMIGRGARLSDNIHPVHGRKLGFTVVDYLPKKARFAIDVDGYTGDGTFGMYVQDDEDNEDEVRYMSEEEKQARMEALRIEHAMKLKEGLWDGSIKPIRAKPNFKINKNEVFKSPFDWVNLGNLDVLFAGVGTDSCKRIYVVETLDKVSRVIFIGQRVNKPDSRPQVKLITSVESRELAIIRASSRAKRWAGGTTSHVNKIWREQPLTPDLIKRADAQGIRWLGMNQGQLSDALNVKFVTKCIESLDMSAEEHGGNTS